MSRARSVIALVALLASGPALADSHARGNWTGFHAGAAIGGAWSNVDWLTTAIGDPLGAPDGVTEAQGFDASAFRFSGYVGYSQAVSDTFIVGIEGEFGVRTGGDERVGFIPGTVFGPAPGTPGDSASVDIGFDGALLLRAGAIVAPNTMIYLTGGLAFADIEVGASCVLFGGNWCIADRRQTKSDVEFGWTLGAGMELSLGDDMFLRGEYRYTSFGSVDVRLFANAPPDQVVTEVEVDTHAVSVGIVRRF